MNPEVTSPDEDMLAKFKALFTELALEMHVGI